MRYRGDFCSGLAASAAAADDGDDCAVLSKVARDCVEPEAGRCNNN